MESSPLSPSARLLGHAGLRQFIKFCLVGLSSTVVDLSIFYLLNTIFGLWWVLADIVSFSLGVTNGFIWNSRWTFNQMENSSPRTRYIKFVAVNLVGLLLSVTIMKIAFAFYFGGWNHAEAKGLVAIAAKLTATPIVVFWNFFANKHWTFKA